MATRRWWAGTLGPFFYDDSVAFLRIETAAGTFELSDVAGQSSSSVNIDGGEIDGTDIGSNTPASGSFTTLAADHLSVDGATNTASFLDAGLTGATELGWIEVTIGSTTGYLRVYSAK